MKIIKNCKFCNVLYKGGSSSVYCSSNCRLLYYKEKYLQDSIQESLDKYKNPYYYIECSICGLRAGQVN